MSKALFFALSSILFQTSILPFQAYAREIVSVINIEEESEIVKLLPEKYRVNAASRLNLAGSNKEQLLLAIKQINKKYIEGLSFLLSYMQENDLKTISSSYLIENIELAYLAKEHSSWGAHIPDDIFLNNVLPFSNVTETRDNWRKDFYQRFFDLASKENSVLNAVKKLNQFVFDTFNVRYHATLRKKPDQSPYESIAIGYASCTGLSILIVDALRSVGIPARLAGIPSWPATGGNHTWVEVWDNGWHYIEAASAGEYDNTWFSGRASEANPQNSANSIYAVSFEKTALKFPMVWDYSSNIYAENVTSRYKK